MNAAMNQPSILTLRLGQSDQAGQCGLTLHSVIVHQHRKRNRPSKSRPKTLNRKWLRFRGRVKGSLGICSYTLLLAGSHWRPNL